MASTGVTIQMDENLKKQIEKLFDEMGLNMTTAITLFAKAVVRQKKIPFEIAAGGPVPADKKIPMPGCMEGEIWIADDFDELPEDFKEYMQ